MPLNQIKGIVLILVDGRSLGAEIHGRCFGFYRPGSSLHSPCTGHVKLGKVLKLSRPQCPHL